MDTERSAAELEKIGEVLRLYAKALSGEEIRIVPRGGVSPRGGGWLTPLSESKAIVIKVPPKIDRFPTAQENFLWYKVILTHQAGHVEFGTLNFSFDRSARLFHNWRSSLAAKRKRVNPASDFDRLLQLFPDQKLGSAIFDCVEDARIDARMLARYPGIRPSYLRVASEVLSGRPRLSLLPLREAFLEGLVQASLHGEPLAQAPDPLKADLRLGLDILGRLQNEEASVEDSAEAALRLYRIAAELPNVPLDECDHHHHERRLRPAEERGEQPDSLEEAVKDPQELPFQPPLEVEFRFEMDHKLFQDIETKTDQEQERRDGANVPQEAEGPLVRDEAFCYLYPEWDFRMGGFRHHWCRVRERIMEEGTSDFYLETLAEYRPLFAQVRARFEHFLPELFHKVNRRFDGEDVDLDGVIEMVVDSQAGMAPSEKIYWRRERTKRDVAVAVLLDVSATTNEFVELEAAKASRPVAGTAREYSEYLKRVAAGVDERGRPLRKRTIEIEKQAAIILMQALEKIGDSYALYAFSGSGRGNVEFYVIKDFHEPLSQRIARRIDRLSPAHATRMGAAIRHAIRKLQRVETQTRLLFLLSDGRPYDRDYGRDAHDQEYAVRDTHQALRDAARQKIRPFCLTVDKEGADYLRAMCEDIPYEVVVRVEELPMRLITIYPKLTA